jgi:hypothetical protein
MNSSQERIRFLSPQACEARHRQRCERLPVAQEMAQRLVAREGSNKAAARAFAERHGVSVSTAERMLTRLRLGRVRGAEASTVDRLSVMI